MTHHRRVIRRNVEGNVPMWMERNKMVQHCSARIEFSPRRRHRKKKGKIRCYLCILPTGSDNQVRDVRFLGGAQECSTNDEVAVHGDHRAPFWGVVQGVANWRQNVVRDRVRRKKSNKACLPSMLSQKTRSNRSCTWGR